MRRTLSLLLIALGLTIPFVRATTTDPTDAATRRLVIVFMENHERRDIVNSGNTPYMNGLRKRGIDFTNYAGVTHPSLPNYLALASGSPAGKTGSDSVSAGHIEATTVWNQLDAHGISWRVYEEGMPSTCYGGSESGRYVLRHNPATPFASIYPHGYVCDRVLPYTRGAWLPSITFITPNICHDMHDCSMATGDAWLKANIEPMIQSGATVVITFDEGDTSTGGGGNVYTVVAGAGVTHRVNSNRYNHYSLLAAIEDRYGMARLKNAASAHRLPLS